MVRHLVDGKIENKRKLEQDKVRLSAKLVNYVATGGVLFFKDSKDSDNSHIGEAAAEDGARMRGGDAPFSTQAARILSQVPLPEHVEVELGGNDICSRECVDPAFCSKPLYTDAEWTEAVRAGLDLLVEGLPQGSTVYLLGVPRVQDLRQAGLEKQSESSSVDCEGIWADFDICEIVTRGGFRDGLTEEMWLATIAARQRRYSTTTPMNRP